MNLQVVGAQKMSHGRPMDRPFRLVQLAGRCLEPSRCQPPEIPETSDIGRAKLRGRCARVTKDRVNLGRRLDRTRDDLPVMLRQRLARSERGRVKRCLVRVARTRVSNKSVLWMTVRMLVANLCRSFGATLYVCHRCCRIYPSALNRVNGRNGLIRTKTDASDSCVCARPDLRITKSRFLVCHYAPSW